ncbi:hypothetical protein CKM354_000715100 [Cercospora kikuchii]|uniref:N-acetyltransferase domain-containing protein n=1 Tax=Cercospora kikuchii TaxID=84275 RepID=A0A9P3CM78_9PEZI|nr:uncharacterized protein CKM354_000715100 [Cercospora kikuchii]GIZ43942.1 hypothetical protein CKM354_000715100 [Cercospora kikuchii]
MDPEFHIATPRLYISHFLAANDSHCDFLVKLWNTPEFIKTCGQTKVKTREDARNEIGGRFLDDHKHNGYGMYLVSLRSDTDDTQSDRTQSFQEVLKQSKPIGTVSLMRGKPPTAFSAPDLGFAILPEETQKGYAREASQALMDYVESALGVKDILGLFDPENKASAAVFRSLQFQDCGVKDLEEFGGLPVAIWVKPGMRKDIALYGL